MQHPPDDSAGQACVVRHLEVTGMGWGRCGPAPIHAPTPRISVVLRRLRYQTDTSTSHRNINGESIQRLQAKRRRVVF